MGYNTDAKANILEEMERGPNTNNVASESWMNPGMNMAITLDLCIHVAIGCDSFNVLHGTCNKQTTFMKAPRQLFPYLMCSRNIKCQELRKDNIKTTLKCNQKCKYLYQNSYPSYLLSASSWYLDFNISAG
jgi:hypothetical protein